MPIGARCLTLISWAFERIGTPNLSINIDQIFLDRNYGELADLICTHRQ